MRWQKKFEAELVSRTRPKTLRQEVEQLGGQITVEGIEPPRHEQILTFAEMLWIERRATDEMRVWIAERDRFDASSKLPPAITITSRR